MLVGLKTVLDDKGELKWPTWLNRGLDTDVIVAEVRETSRKPDEVYGIIERMCPGGRKVEIFGRRHNTRPGFVHLLCFWPTRTIVLKSDSTTLGGSLLGISLGKI